MDELFIDEMKGRILNKIMVFQKLISLTFQQSIDLLKRIQPFEDQVYRSNRSLAFFLGTMQGTKLTSLYFQACIVGSCSDSFCSYMMTLPILKVFSMVGFFLLLKQHEKKPELYFFFDLLLLGESSYFGFSGEYSGFSGSKFPLYVVKSPDDLLGQIFFFHTISNST